MKSLACLFSAFSIAAGASAADASFSLESSTFKDGGQIPAKCAMLGVAGGKNLSPALSWKNPPPGAKSFAVACTDVHPVARNWVHWMVFKIPGDVSSIPEGGRVKGAVEAANSFGKPGWGGPMPPPGSGAHKYVFTVYALSDDGAVDVPAGATLYESDAANRIFKGRILGKASITGTFER